MTALTRRTLGKLLASAAAFLHLPFRSTIAGPAIPQTASVQDRVQASVDGLTPDAIFRAFDGTYRKIFRFYPSTMQVERTAHVLYLGPQSFAPLREDEITRADGVMRLVNERARQDNGYGQRWLYNAVTKDVSFWFSVVADDDPRARDTPDIASKGLLRRDAKVQPWRVSDVDKALAKLLSTHQEERESEAADVLRRADTYDASIGGDGKALCSTEHPYEHGVWVNTFATQCDLNPVSFAAACALIDQYHDEGGIHIAAKPFRLIAGSAYAEHDDYSIPTIIWDRLQPYAWFVLTTIAGLRCYERTPFEISVWKDHETGEVIVQGYERRCFTYTDPRAVFGCVPPRDFQGI